MSLRGLLAMSALLLISAPAWAGPLEDLSALQLRTLRSVRAPFRQEKRTELLPRPIKSTGTFYYRKGSGVRWEYDGQMVVIYDNETLYLHYTELGEAEKVRGVAGFKGPLSFDVKELGRDYEITASASAEGVTTLDLQPRAVMPFKSMRMLFRKDEPFPYEVRVLEETGDETVISFIGPELNAELKKGLFVFKAPRGVKVRERTYE